jgi:hypothetical protein
MASRSLLSALPVAALTKRKLLRGDHTELESTRASSRLGRKALL